MQTDFWMVWSNFCQLENTKLILLKSWRLSINIILLHICNVFMKHTRVGLTENTVNFKNTQSRVVHVVLLFYLHKSLFCLVHNSSKRIVNWTCEKLFIQVCISYVQFSQTIILRILTYQSNAAFKYKTCFKMLLAKFWYNLKEILFKYNMRV